MAVIPAGDLLLPGALDLYSWLAYKTWNAARKRAPQTVSWDGLHAQMGADYAELRDFKKKVRALLPKIEHVYPQMKVSHGKDGLIISPAPGAITDRVR